MLAKLKAHIESHNLFNTQNKLLLGVSAGVDSMVLSHLLKELHFNFIIAHMNFGLRGRNQIWMLILSSNGVEITKLLPLFQR